MHKMSNVAAVSLSSVNETENVETVAAVSLSAVNETENVETENVPLWLQCSDFFSKSTLMHLHLQCCLFTERPHLIRENCHVIDLNDFAGIMLCIDYWGVDYSTWSPSIYSFVAANVNEVKNWRDGNGTGIAKHLDFSDQMLTLLPFKKGFMRDVSELGSLGWMKYGHSQTNFRSLNHPLADRLSSCFHIIRIAAREGHLSCLKFAHENGYPFTYFATSNAARNGNLACLDYLHAKGCPWNSRTCTLAATAGHLACLQFAHVNGCTWNSITCCKAAGAGQLACLEYAHVNGCAWDAYTCSLAARYGKLDCLQFAHLNGCRWGITVCLNAAGANHLPCLQYAHVMGCPWNERVFAFAAFNGNLSCLQYAHTEGLLWDADTCALAALGGNIDCLQYARAKGCPWGEWPYPSTLPDPFPLKCEWSLGLAERTQSCMEYAHANGSPWDMSKINCAPSGYYCPVRRRMNSIMRFLKVT